MIFIAAKFRPRPEDVERWPHIVHDYTTAVRAEKGCLWFDWSRSLDDPDEYILLEAYRDDQAGADHVNSPHFKTAQHQLPPHLSETPRIINTSIPQTDWDVLGELTVND